MGKLGVAVLGVGEMGKRHAENIRRQVPEARLVAVADVAASRAKLVAAELEIERSFGSLEDMLERKEVDCVLIATPDKLHAQAVCTAAAAGKNILELKRVRSASRSSLNRSGVTRMLLPSRLTSPT